jgi:serine/threonine protein kinase
MSSFTFANGAIAGSPLIADHFVGANLLGMIAKGRRLSSSSSYKLALIVIGSSLLAAVFGLTGEIKHSLINVQKQSSW